MSTTEMVVGQRYSPPPSIDDYDGSPQAYGRLAQLRRTQKDGINEFQAAMNLIKGLIGTGILSLPYAFYNAGLWTGSALLVVTVLLSTHCMGQLARAAHYFAFTTGQSALSYEDVVACSCRIGPPWMSRYANLFRNSISLQLAVCQLGICCVYVVFIAENLRQPMDGVAGLHWSVRTLMTATLPVLLAVCSVRQLRLLAVLSCLANAVFLAAFAVTMRFVVHNLPAVQRLPAFAGLDRLPLAFGTIVFSFEGISLILPIENKCTNPRRFVAPLGTLNISCAVVLVLYMMLGFLGYVQFGDRVRDSITLNLPSDVWLYDLVRVAFALALCLSYPVQFYVPVEMVDGLLESWLDGAKSRWLVPAQYLCRYGLVVVTFALAQLVPYLGLFISLVGSMTGSLLALILPPIVETIIQCYQKPRNGQWYWTMTKNTLICIFGTLGAVSGSAVALREIATKFA